jgi:[ribosomal protein S5]-alanine N-acetyltransferase
MQMPSLETARLLVRPLAMDDLDPIYQILDIDLGDAELGNSGPRPKAARAGWLEWTVLNYQQLALLYQPPYGERAIVLRQTGQLIGAVGFVPCLAPFGQLPALAEGGPAAQLNTTEFGMFWAIAPAHQRQGYAAEAGGAMIDYAFRQLRLRRIVATTTYDNAASIGVMRKLGMRIERNPYPDPPWLQIVGVLANPAA